MITERNDRSVAPQTLGGSRTFHMKPQARNPSVAPQCPTLAQEIPSTLTTPPRPHPTPPIKAESPPRDRAVPPPRSAQPRAPAAAARAVPSRSSSTGCSARSSCATTRSAPRPWSRLSPATSAPSGRCCRALPRVASRGEGAAGWARQLTVLCLVIADRRWATWGHRRPARHARVPRPDSAAPRWPGVGLVWWTGLARAGRVPSMGLGVGMRAAPAARVGGGGRSVVLVRLRRR